MVMFMKQVGIIGVVFLVAGVALAESRFEDLDQESGGAGYKATYQVGFATDFRLDDLADNRYVPSVTGRFYWFLRPQVALRAGLTYNSFTRLAGPAGYHTVAADIGFRFDFPRAHLTPYLETGLWLPYFWGVDHGYEYDDFHPGIRFAAGLSLRVTSKAELDLSISQVVNHVKEDVIAVSPTSPFGGGDFRPYHDPYGAYNETRVELGVRLEI